MAWHFIVCIVCTYILNLIMMIRECLLICADLSINCYWQHIVGGLSALFILILLAILLIVVVLRLLKKARRGKFPTKL